MVRNLGIKRPPFDQWPWLKQPSSKYTHVKKPYIYIYIYFFLQSYTYMLSKIQEQCSIRRLNLMATTMATLRAKTMAGAMAVASTGQHGWQKNDRGNGSGNSCGKKRWQSGRGKARAANSMAKFGLRARTLGNTCIYILKILGAL